MNKNQKGIAPVIIILIIVILLAGGILVWQYTSRVPEEGKLEEEIVPPKEEKVEEAEGINSFEECLALRKEIGWLDSKTISIFCECDTPDGRVFVRKVENVENLTAKYTDKELNFSFYYLKSSEISESKPSEYFPEGDIYLTKVGPSDDIIIITKYIGQRVENYDAKFGRIAYYYDEDKEQWMKDVDTDYESGISPTEPSSYTISGLPIFSGVGRWATRIVALSTDKFLIIKITGSGWTGILDPLTKTVVKIDQKINEEELKNLLKEEICSLQRY